MRQTFRTPRRHTRKRDHTNELSLPPYDHSPLLQDYQGNASVTASGRTCQEWMLDTPWAHDYNAAMCGDVGTDYHRRFRCPGNACRHPDGESNGPWCYTTDPHKEWEYCDIPQCLPPASPPASPSPTVPPYWELDGWEAVGCYKGDGSDYEGSANVTGSGRPCKSWDESKGFTHLPENYCRNPDGEDLPWCYADPATGDAWELCTQIPECPPPFSGEGCILGTGKV